MTYVNTDVFLFSWSFGAIMLFWLKRFCKIGGASHRHLLSPLCVLLAPMKNPGCYLATPNKIRGIGDLVGLVG